MASRRIKSSRAPNRRSAAFGKRTLDRRRTSGELDFRTYMARLPEIPARWATDPHYLHEGSPLALPLHGRGKTLAKLIRAVVPDGDPEQIARALVQSRAVRRSGNRFVVVSRYMSLSEEPPVAEAQAFDSAMLLIQTMQHNVACEDPRRRLLERRVVNMAIPVRCLPEVHAQYRIQMGALLERFDSYLREFEVQQGSEPTTTVIFGAYAAEHPPVTGTSRATTQRGRRPTQRRGKL